MVPDRGIRRPSLAILRALEDRISSSSRPTRTFFVIFYRTEDCGQRIARLESCKRLRGSETRRGKSRSRTPARGRGAPGAEQPSSPEVRQAHARERIALLLVPALRRVGSATGSTARDNSARVYRPLCDELVGSVRLLLGVFPQDVTVLGGSWEVYGRRSASDGFAINTVAP